MAESAARFDPALEGRRKTAAALDRLSTSRWTVLNGVPWPGRRNVKIDHVVIGPPGIFVIQALDWHGYVADWEDALRQEGNALTSAEEAAWAVSQLTPSVPIRMVHPVICIVRDKPVHAQVADVLVWSSANIAQMLDARIHELSLEQLRVAPMHLRAHVLNSSAAVVSEPPVKGKAHAPTKEPRRVRTWRRPREEKWRKGKKSPGLAMPLAATLCALAVFVAAPEAVIAGAQAFGNLLTEHLAG